MGKIDKEEAIKLCEETLEKCETVISDNPKGADFASSIQDKVESIMETIEKYGSVSEKQLGALTNMNNGISKWIRE